MAFRKARLVLEPTAPFAGPFAARQVEGSVRIWEVYSQTAAGSVVVRADFTGLNVNARSAGLWLAAAMNAKWNIEQNIAASKAAFSGGKT